MTVRPASGADDASRGVTRRSVLTGGVLGAVGLVVGTGAGTAQAVPTAPAAPHGPPGDFPHRSSFVTARGGQFWKDGKRFRFGGTNNYYLHQQSNYMIDAALNDIANMSLPVVRAWAFADGSGQSYTPLQPEPFVYDDHAFDRLDYAIWKAGQLGLRLVLPLVNNWPDYGGMQQYVKWFLNLPDDTFSTAINHDKFYTTDSIKKCYKAYAAHVTRRRNPYTGLRYNEDPTIMTFELANEPRNRSDKTGAPVLAWVTEMSAWVKSLAPRQLVAVGDEGFYGDATNFDYPYSNFEGNQWKKFIALKTVDYGTYHLYPQGWGENPSSKPGTDPGVWGTQWIKDHLADGKSAGKPVVLEEYGLQINATTGVPDEAARDVGYKAWTDTVLNGGGAGDQFWLLTSRVDDGSFYPNYDGYRIMWDNDASNDSNSTAQLLSAHAKTMGA
jgi:mannan endo-1,4-beta-mannosidase